MLKISTLTPNYSAVYAKEFELTVLLNSFVKMVLANLLFLVIDLVKVKDTTPKLYQKKSVIKNDQILLVKEAQENEAGELIRYVYKIRQDSSFLSLDEGIDNISVGNEKCISENAGIQSIMRFW